MPGSDGSAALPVIDVGPLTGPAPASVAGQIQAACRERGFFYVTGHGVPAGLVDQLAEASAEFFALPLADKLEIAMDRRSRRRGRGEGASHPLPRSPPASHRSGLPVASPPSPAPHEATRRGLSPA